MRAYDVGRWMRSHRVTARGLTEFRVATLPRKEQYGDLRACVAAAVPGSLAVDVGASVGNFALALARKVGPRGQVLALEANAEVFRELRMSTWGTAVTPLNLAASSTNGWSTLGVPVSSAGQVEFQLGSLEPRPAAMGQRVRRVRLDDLIDGNRPVSIIKIDVEGHEADVIAGATETIAEHRPTLVIEIEARHTSVERATQAVAHIVELGYRCEAIQGTTTIAYEEFSFADDQLVHLTDDLREIREGHGVAYTNNFLFSPRGR